MIVNDNLRYISLYMFLLVPVFSPGYRHVHLLSKDGTKIPPASLFVYLRIEDIANPVQDPEG